VTRKNAGPTGGRDEHPMTQGNARKPGHGCAHAQWPPRTLGTRSDARKGARLDGAASIAA
jgi:hypothetical protein